VIFYRGDMYVTGPAGVAYRRMLSISVVRDMEKPMRSKSAFALLAALACGCSTLAHAGEPTHPASTPATATA